MTQYSNGMHPIPNILSKKNTEPDIITNSKMIQCP